MLAISLFCGGFVTGCQHEQTAQEKIVRQKEHQYQSEANKIRTEKDAQIKAINNQLVDAISSLRSRSNNPTKTINGQDCNGATLSAPDAEFLIREAARADQIRIGLETCYKQYDSIN
jgi:hypothetical protein